MQGRGNVRDRGTLCPFGWCHLRFAESLGSCQLPNDVLDLFPSVWDARQTPLLRNKKYLASFGLEAAGAELVLSTCSSRVPVVKADFDREGFRGVSCELCSLEQDVSPDTASLGITGFAGLKKIKDPAPFLCMFELLPPAKGRAGPFTSAFLTPQLLRLVPAHGLGQQRSAQCRVPVQGSSAEFHSCWSLADRGYTDEAHGADLVAGEEDEEDHEQHRVHSTWNPLAAQGSLGWLATF